MNGNMQNLQGTPYYYDLRLGEQLTDLRQRVNVMRHIVGTLSADSLTQVREFFRLKNIYNSNAIEGNSLSLGETQLVIREGLTISGKPLRDTLEAKNLNHALDFFEEIVKADSQPLTVQDIRNIHALILRGIDDRNAGAYRTVQVKISGSRYTPPEPARIDGEMKDLDQWLPTVSIRNPISDVDPVIAACAAHAWFVTIHPFIDGNGRTARLLMNLVLMRHGYPLTIITKDDRQRYYDSLEESQGTDLTPFIALVLESAQESIEVYEQAAESQVAFDQAVLAVVQQQETQLRNEYELFNGAMGILRASFRQFSDALAAQSPKLSSKMALTDFGILEFEKYQSLRLSQSAKKTWYFRLTIFTDDPQKPAQRYLFFFGFPGTTLSQMTGKKQVTLHVAAEVYPFYYERLTNINSSDYPSVVEIGYLPSEEQFVYLDHKGSPHRERADKIAQLFITQAIDLFRKP